MSAALPASAEVVVIGGGIMGTSSAFHLAEAGVEVLLLERASLSAGSSSKSAGGVRAQFSDAVNIALGARSLEAFENFGERPGAHIDLQQVGYLILHTDAEAWAKAQAAVALQNSMGVTSRLLTADEAGTLSPGANVTDVLGATFHPRDGFVSPESVIQGYARGAREHGASIRTGIEVVGIDVVDGDITGVRTTAGTIATNAVVCAAGPWSRAIGEFAGVDLPIEPLRRQIVVTQALPPAVEELFPRDVPMTVDAARTFYFHREGPGLLVGMSYQAETTGWRDSYSEEWLPTFLEAMEHRAPALLDLGLAHQWAGYYEVTPDHNALIGESKEVSRFLYAAGFSGHGFLQGPAIGEVIRDLYLGQEPFLDLSGWTADRFAAGKSLYELNII